MTSILSIESLNTSQLLQIIDHALTAKSVGKGKSGWVKDVNIQHKHFAMLFEKPSLRTMASFQVGIKQLGGHVDCFDLQDNKLGQRESIKDIASNLSQYYDGIIARVDSNQTLQLLDSHAFVPVINALCDLHHPCQALADMVTLFEVANYSDKKREELSVVYIGDGNNVCHSLMQACAKLSISLQVLTPERHKPSDVITVSLSRYGRYQPKVLHHVEDVSQADVIYTDTWLSMGESSKSLQDFNGFQVTKELMQSLNANYFMHCQPLHRGHEVSAEVADGTQSIIYQQAQNRLHAQNALLSFLYGHYFNQSRPNTDI